MRSNQALRELSTDLNLVADNKKKKLARIRHVVRMNQGRIVKNIPRSKPDECKKGEGLK